MTRRTDDLDRRYRELRARAASGMEFEALRRVGWRTLSERSERWCVTCDKAQPDGRLKTLRRQGRPDEAVWVPSHWEQNPGHRVEA